MHSSDTKAGFSTAITFSQEIGYDKIGPERPKTNITHSLFLEYWQNQTSFSKKTTK